MDLFYRLMVLYFVIHLIFYIVRERKLWSQVSAVIVLVLFALRLLLIK
jgi:hypothetical protein